MERVIDPADLVPARCDECGARNVFDGERTGCSWCTAMARTIRPKASA